MTCLKQHELTGYATFDITSAAKVWEQGIHNKENPPLTYRHYVEGEKRRDLDDQTAKTKAKGCSNNQKTYFS